MKKNMKEIRILILSHMYPRVTDSVSGIFIHQHVKNLLRIGCRVTIISPIPYVPRILQTNLRRKGYRKTQLVDTIEGVTIYYPRYIRLPGQWFHGLSCYTMYWGIKNTVKQLINNFKPDILHVHVATPDGYVGLML